MALIHYTLSLTLTHTSSDRAVCEFHSSLALNLTLMHANVHQVSCIACKPVVNSEWCIVPFMKLFQSALMQRKVLRMRLV